MSIPQRQAVRRLLGSVASVVCPPGMDERGLTEAVIDHAELSLQAFPPVVRAGFLAGLTGYEMGALARFGTRASRLDPDRAHRYFVSWRHGLAIQQELAKALKGILCLAYYEMPEVQEDMGYRPAAWIESVRKRRLAVYADDIARHEHALFAPEPLLPPPISPGAPVAPELPHADHAGHAIRPGEQAPAAVTATVTKETQP